MGIFLLLQDFRMSDDAAMVTNRLCVRMFLVSWGGGDVKGCREGYIRSDIGFCRLPFFSYSHITFAGG